MPKPMHEHGFSAGMCLPYNEIKLFCDVETPAFDDVKMKQVVTAAEGYLSVEVPMCPASLYHRFATDGNRSEYEAVYFKRRDMAMKLALAEAYEKKGRFTEKLVDAVWAIMEESSWTVPAHLAMYSPSHGDLGLPAVYNDERLHAIDLFSAGTAALLSMVYLYCKDILDGYCTVICEKLKYLVTERQIKPFVNCVFHWMGLLGNAVNNWNPWVCSNILFTVAVMADDDRTLQTVVGKAAQCTDRYTAGMPEDGGCDEGANYWTVAGASYFDVLEILYDITGGKYDIYGDQFIKSMCEYIVKMYIHGHRFINFADCPPYVRPDGSQIRRMGEKCGSPTLCLFGDGIDSFGSLYLNSNCIYRTLRSLITPPHPGKSLGMMRTWIPSLKIMCARQYEDTGKGMFAAMKGGHNSEGHNHIDVGNVVVFFDGEPVMIDTGAGTYKKQTFSAGRYELWYMQSGYHNVADIGGYEQRPGVRFRSSDEKYDEATGGATMQLREAYPEQAGVVSYVRKTVLDGGEVRITDSFELDTEKEIDIHFITCEKPLAVPDGISLPHGRIMSFDKGLQAEIEEFEVRDDGIERNWHSPVLWRIHLRAVVKKASFTVRIR